MSFTGVLASKSRFGAFWASFSLSVLGDAVTKTALIWYVLEQTGSSISLGWLSFWLTAPVIAGGLVAGWLLDRFDRRRIMALDSLIKAGVVLSLPVLSTIGVLQIWFVYAAAAVLGFLMMIPLAGVPSLLTSLVEKDELTAANSLETIGYTFGGVAGPPLAGFLIVTLEPLDALYLDAATYLAFAAATLRCRLRQEQTEQTDKASGRLVDAVLMILRHSILFSTTLMYLVFNIGLGTLLVVIPVVSEQALDGGPQLYGTLLACLALGEFAGSVVTGTLRLPIPEGLAICFAAILSGLGIGVAAVGSGAIWLGVGMALYGAFSAPLTIWAQTLRMRIIPPSYQGRCFAIMRTLMQSGGPAGGLSAGYLLPVAGPRLAVSAIALLTVLIGASGLLIADLRKAR